MDTSSAASPPAVPPVARKSLWRWPLRLVGLLFVAAVIAVAAAPTVVSSNPELRDYLVHRFMGKLNGDIVIKKFSIGWTTPLEIEGFEIRPHADSQPVPGTTANVESLVKVDRVEAERSLWGILWNRSDIGTIRIERPDVFLALGDKPGESNFEKVFRPILERGARLPKSLTFGARMQIVDGKLRGMSNETREPWEIPGVSLAVGIRSAELSKSGKPELYVEKGTLLKNGEVNAGLCNDVLKYAAPVAAKVARARGTITIELDDWRLPWRDFAGGELSGRLTMNSVEVGPGSMIEAFVADMQTKPLVGELVRAYPLPKFVNVARDSVVEFRMVAGGRIEHKGLRFSLADVVDVQTHGTVGLDETLDLTAALGIHPPNPEERHLALMRQLSNQQWSVRIRGKLGHPEVDLSPLADEWKQLLLRRVPMDWLSGRPSVGSNVIGTLNETGILNPERTGALLGLLQQLSAPKPTPAPYQVQKVDPNVAPASGTATGPTLGAPDGAPTNPASPTNPPSLTVPPPPSPPAAASPTTVPAPPTAAAMPTPSGTAEAPKFGVADGVKLGLDVLGAIRARRQEQQRPPILPPGIIPSQPPTPSPRESVDPTNPSPAANPPGANPPSAGLPPVPTGTAPTGTVPPPRRPLRQGLRMLLEAATQPPPPTPTGSQPPATQPPAAQPPTGPAPTSKPPEPELPSPAKREP